MEEYYQQIGRAGRDGLHSDCYTFYTGNDFMAFKQDWATKSIPPQRLPRLFNMMDEFRTFCESSTNCKRHDILRYFAETPTFTKCEMCGNCRRSSMPTSALRDFTEPSLILLEALKSCGTYQPSWTNLAKKVKEVQNEKLQVKKALDGGGSSSSSSSTNNKKKPPMPLRGWSIDFFKKLIAPLMEKGLVARTMMKGTNKYGSTWDVYAVTNAASTMLRSPHTCTIMMPPTEAILATELAEQQAVDKRMQIHMNRGIDLSIVPQIEKDAGTGPTLQTLTTWHLAIKRFRDAAVAAPNDSTSTVNMADKYIQLRQRIMNWRDETAQLQSIAPTTVMREILSYKIAYSKVTTKADLINIGVRSSRIDDLARLLATSIVELNMINTTKSENETAGAKMIMPTGTFQPQNFYHYSPVCFAFCDDHFRFRSLPFPSPPPSFFFLPQEPGKKPPKKEPSWKINYRLFMDSNKSPSVIAATGGNTPIQLNTVVNHLLYGLVSGLPLDLDRLWASLPDNEIQLHEGIWNELERVNEHGDLSMKNIWNQGTGQKNFNLTGEISDKIMRSVSDGELIDVLDTNYADRSDEQKAKYSAWRAATTRWSLLKRARVPIRFEKKLNGNKRSREEE